MSAQRTKVPRALLAAVTALILACGHTAEEPAADATAAASPARSAGVRRMAALQISLAALGYLPLPSRIVADVAEGERCTLSLTAADDGRVVAVAIGEPDALSLDLRVEGGPGGRALASDVSRGRRAAAAFSARKGEVYTITTTASAGAGTAVVAVFRSPLATPPPPLATLFDADPSPRLSWSELADILCAEGYEPVADPIDFEVSEAAHRSFPFELRKDSCYAFVALGSSGVDAIALRVHGGAELLSADFADRYHAWAQLCAEENEQVRASVDVTAGTGGARLGLFAAKRDDVAALVGPAVVPTSRPRTLDVALRRAADEVERRGYGPAEVLTTARIDGAGTRLPVPLPPGSGGCYALVATAEDAEADIDLQIVLERRGAPGEAIELADPSDGPDSRIAVCHGDDVQASATLIAVRGAGRVAVARHPLPMVAIDAGGEEPPLAASEAAARLGRVGMKPLEPHPEVAPCADGFCASVRAKGGRCYGAIAFSQGGRISRLVVRERGAEDHATEWSGDSEGPEIAWCAETDADYDLAATALGESAKPPVIITFAGAAL